MNADPATAAPTHAAHGSPGAALRNARARAGLSIEELASRTRLSRQTLEALEADAFEQLLEPVYVRGYYRKCAGILELAEQPLIEAYDAMYMPPPKTAPARLPLASGGDLGSSPRFATKLAVLGPLAAVVIIALLWMLRQAPMAPNPPATVMAIDPTLPAASITAPAAPADASAPVVAAEPGTPAQDLPPSDATGVVPVDPALAAATAPAEAAPVEAPPAPPAPTAPQPVGTQLELQFDAISWARVEDASGKSLLSGVISAGEKQTLDGQPPYSVFLGNAPGVKVTFGGLPVDVKPFVKSNSTARFSVPAAGN